MENGHDSKGNVDDHGNKEVMVEDYRENKAGEADDPNKMINGDVENPIGAVYTYTVPEENIGESSRIGQEWAYALDIADESSLDNEVGRRLNDMVPVPVSLYLFIITLIWRIVCLWV